MKYDAADLEKGLMHSTLKSGRRHYTVSGRCEEVVVVIKVPLIKSCGGLFLQNRIKDLGRFRSLMFMNFLYPFENTTQCPAQICMLYIAPL